MLVDAASSSVAARCFNEVSLSRVVALDDALRVEWVTDVTAILDTAMSAADGVVVAPGLRPLVDNLDCAR